MRTTPHIDELERLALTAAEVARLLHISQRQVWALHSSGRLPRPIHLGRSVRWNAVELRDWIAAGAPERSKWEAKIRRSCHVSGVVSFSTWTVPAHCQECGKPYPWTERKAVGDAIEELDELSETERDKLKQSILDVLHKTPSTRTAAARFKKAIGRASTIAGTLLKDVLIKVATEALAKALGIFPETPKR